MIDIKCVQQLKEHSAEKMVYPCYAQIKMDGIFGRWDPPTQKFYTRSGNQIQGLSVLEKELAPYDAPLDGELVIPGMDFFKMNGLIRSFNQTPDCKFYVFDAPHATNPFNDRFEFYTALLKPCPPHVVTMQVHLISNVIDADLLYDKALNASHEGVVYKRLTALYRKGKHWPYLKRTPTTTCECTILDAFEGQGKFSGMLGGFIVDFNGIKVRVGGGPGIDMDVRRMAWRDRADFIGKPLKCSYKKTTVNGSMRSPQMMGLRWDI